MAANKVGPTAAAPSGVLPSAIVSFEDSSDDPLNIVLVPIAPNFGNASISNESALFTGKRRALLVAGHYPEGSGVRPLRGTFNDVELMKRLLEENTAIGRFDEIVCLNSNDSSADTYASRKNITDHWEALAKKTKPEDIFVFYFSGHGTEFYDKDKPTELSQALVPSGVKYNTLQASDCITDTYVEGTILQKILKTNGAKNITFIFDSCHSGDMTRFFDGMPSSSQNDDDPRAKHVPSKARLKRAMKLKPSDLPSSDLLPAVIRRPDLMQQDYSDYVVVSGCQSAGLSMELDLKTFYDLANPTATRPHGVLTYYLYKVLTTMLAKAPELINWRQVMRVVQQKAFNKTKQLPQLEGLRDWIPFGIAARPLVPYLVVNAAEGGTITLAGGHLHGAENSSIWSITATDGTKHLAMINKAYSQCLKGGYGIPEDGVEAEAYLKDPNVNPELLINCYAVCLAIPAESLPKIHLEVEEGASTPFDLNRLRKEFSLFTGVSTSQEDADLIVRHGTGTFLDVPGFGSGWMSSPVLETKYAEIARVFQFLYFWNRYTTDSGCNSMKPELAFKITPSHTPDGFNYFLPDQTTDVSILLKNMSPHRQWYLSVFIFRPDFSIDQRHPLEGTQEVFLGKVKYDNVIFTAGDNSLRDGHGNARFVIRAIITSRYTDLSLLTQGKITITTTRPQTRPLSPTMRPFGNLASVGPPQPKPEDRGFAVVDRTIILQPTNLDDVIQLGLMHDARWTMPFQKISDFNVLKNALLGSNGLVDPSATGNSKNMKNRLPWPIESLKSMPFAETESSLSTSSEPCIVLLSCYDHRKEPFQYIGNTETWTAVHIAPKSAFKGPWDLEFEKFAKVLSQDDFPTKAKSLTLVIHRNAVYPIKYYLTQNSDAEWVKKISGFIFLNAVHVKPETLTYAGLISILPHWRTIADDSNLESWFEEIAAGDKAFLERFEHVPMTSIDTETPQQLFKISDRPEMHLFKRHIVRDVQFFDLAYCNSDSTVHKLLGSVVTKTESS